MGTDGGLSQEINSTAQDVAKLPLKADQLQKPSWPGKFHQKIDVTVRTGISSGKGPKQGHTASPAGFAMVYNLFDFIGIHGACPFKNWFLR
jgi:hypothetical protein